MSDDRNSKMLPPAPRHRGSSKGRQESGVAPVLQLRFRRRGRSISRIVVIDAKPEREGLFRAFELFFALG
jgi:hypothetical protein